jgi:putative ABC transport system substrate-binding protein
MRRRHVIHVVCAALVLSVVTVRAQQSARIHRIGFLANSTAALEHHLIEPFRDGLRELGYEEGRNIALEFRWAEGRYERFPALIAELLGLKVDVIVTAGTPAALAVKKATATVPLVMVAVGDPVGTGLAESLARPGGNATGLTSIAPELQGKRLELLQEVTPKLSHFAVLWNPVNPIQVIEKTDVQAAASALKMRVLSVPVRTADELDGAFASILLGKPEGLIVLADRLFLHNRTRIMEFAAQHRFPGVHAYRELVEAGGLVSYGPNYADMHKRAAVYVGKILKGAKPADLPIERPVKFELVVNVSAAKALGLTISPTLLARADEVIE